MNISNLEKKHAFKSRTISDVRKFNNKHKKLSFLGIAYTCVSLVTYNLWFYIYCNSTRFISLICILLFFALSTSFSYPDVFPAAQELIERSDAKLVDTKVIDEQEYAGEDTAVNPDVAEMDDLVSGSDILVDLEVDDETEESLPAVIKESDVDHFSSDDWKLILVNKQHPIPDDYKFVLGEISSGMKCDERVIKPLCDMLKAAKDDGVSLIVGSPYRDINRQTMLFDKKVRKYMNSGMSYMDAYKLSSQAVTVPGSSEHQIGLAVDIITDGYITLDEGFADTPAGKWLADNCYKYGFILRYPAGKEEITSIEFEPWHFRYVGVEAATVMTKNGICLEEFWNKYVDKE